MAEGSVAVGGELDALDETTVSAAAVRAALGLTPHQLSELTAGLRVDVGPRPNYPRYRRADVHRMTAVQMLRELRTPVDAALRAADMYGSEVLAGAGWLLAAPGEVEWTVAVARTGPDLVMWLRAAGGRWSVLDLDAVATRADVGWAAASREED